MTVDVEGGVGMICANCSVGGLRVQLSTRADVKQALRPLFTSLMSSASTQRGTPYPGNHYSRSHSGPSQNANRPVLNGFRTAKGGTVIDEMEGGFRLEDMDVRNTQKGTDVLGKDDASDERILIHST